MQLLKLRKMTLIKSISGIRGTIGGCSGDNLTPSDIVKFTLAYAKFTKEICPNKTRIIVGRDARISGKMVENIVVSSLQSMGLDVISLGLASTPTTEIAVRKENAAGGIIITASHNPQNWNALKLLNENGEFLTADEGKRLLEIADSGDFEHCNYNEIGKLRSIDNYEDIHIEHILSLPIINTELIRQCNFKVVIDCVNSVGGISFPKLLNKLGVTNIIKMYCDPTGEFPHNPEPLPENLTEISKVIVENKADVGFVTDPDVDRLAIVCEDGSMFGEEYSLVACADFVLSKKPGNTVSNMSSTRALKDITLEYGKQHYSSAVGEVNVVEAMKKYNAVIGGEGNGGVIYPESHYGRDALVGIALFLSLLAERKIKASELKKSYPLYYISKNKITLDKSLNIDNIIAKIEEKYKEYPKQTIDGLRIDFHEEREWVHLRKSNTEPIIRIYAESKSETEAEKIAQIIIQEIKTI